VATHLHQATAGFIGGRLAPVKTALDASMEPGKAPQVPSREAVQRWRLVLAREAILPDAAQREQLAAWEAALVASGLPVAGLDAPRARPRFAPAAPLAAGIPGEAELLDIWLVERRPAWQVREALLACLPSGWRLVDLHDVWLGEAALPGRVAASVYRATFAPGSVRAADLRTAADDLLGAAALPRERRKGDGTVAYDLRPFLDGIAVTNEGDGTVVVRMTLRHDPEKGVGRPDEALAALGDGAGVPLTPTTFVREGLVLGEPLSPPPPVARRRPAGRTAGST
jgi:hypothetical protein